MRRKLGYKYTTNEQYLRSLDRFATLKGETSIGFTKAFADEWGIKRPNETETNRGTRISILSYFSSFLRDIGIDSYIPKIPPYQKPKFIPCIFSNLQMDRIFKASDGLRSGRNASMNTCIMAIPAIIRVLYGTGIRIGEVLNLKISDLIMEHRCIKIRDVKSKKERIIPISDSLWNVVQTYIGYRNSLPEDNLYSEYLFIKPDGRRCTDEGIRRWFRKCVQTAKINEDIPGVIPRVHDLRHSFAVNSLAGMVADSIDLYVALPILSNYLGHQNINSTEHYVRLTTNMFPDLRKALDRACIDIFPKFINYE